MFESRRLDLDRMAKNRLDLDLIVTVHPRSGGQGVSGAWGRRRATAGDPVRGGGAPGSPEHANPAFPGSDWHGVWPRMDYAPCVVHLGSSWISGSPGVGKARATAALRTAARRRSAIWARKGPKGLDNQRKRKRRGH